MTPIDKVRAALEGLIRAGQKQGFNDAYETEMRNANQALSELSGMALVPVEPTQERLDKMAKFAIAVRLSSEYTWRDYVRDLHGIVIAPYVKGE